MYFNGGNLTQTFAFCHLNFYNSANFFTILCAGQGVFKTLQMLLTPCIASDLYKCSPNLEVVFSGSGFAVVCYFRQGKCDKKWSGFL